MGDSDTGPAITTYVDGRSRVESAVLALLTPFGFDRARRAVPDLKAYCDFRTGLAMAGVDVKMAPLAVEPFIGWLRLTGTPASEQALNTFALLVSTFRNGCRPLVLAAIGEGDFEAHAGNFAALSRFDSFAKWARRREEVRAQAVSSGARLQELPIQLRHFGDWVACLGPAAGGSVDDYARLLLEYFAGDFEE
jgi:hypothetical protein